MVLVVIMHNTANIIQRHKAVKELLPFTVNPQAAGEQILAAGHGFFNGTTCPFIFMQCKGNGGFWPYGNVKLTWLGGEFQMRYKGI